MKAAVLVLIGAAALPAATTEIRDTRYTADGRQPNGEIEIEWPGFTTAGGKVIPEGRRTRAIRHGKIHLRLEPTPPGVTYKITYSYSDGTRITEYWDVPESATPVTISELLSEPPVITPLSHEDAEIPAGVVDGANKVFTLQRTPNPASSLILIRNGLIVSEGVDYTLSGQTVTFVEAPTPGDVMRAWYRW